MNLETAPGVPTLDQKLFSLRSSKLRNSHLARFAFIYVRQSTTNQVLNNRESTARQYSLADYAASLGWPKDRIQIIDEDQGMSGATAEGRSGFQRLLSEVSHDRVGLILGIELSRLARSNKDWHQLIELCAIFNTMLADQDGIYDPSDFNDRLLLGLRGIMNEAELHVLQGRMHQALLAKAKRGEIYVRAPIGYIKLPNGRFSIDPDEQVQSTIRMIFDEFGRRGSIRAVLQFIQDANIKLPIRSASGSNKGLLEWRDATPTVVHRILTHHVYSGTYRFGHRQTDPRLKKPGFPGSGRREVPPEKYHALIENHCPAYITKELFDRNQLRIRENRFQVDSNGAAREGTSLLAGITYCARCGRRMTVCYSSSKKVLRYVCSTGLLDFRSPRCQSLSGKAVDDFVAEKILTVLEPAGLEISLLAAKDVAHAQEKFATHRKQSLERSRFEADRAYRQFQAVEPENRL